MNQINVVCLKWGNKYDAGYVNKLYAGVKRNSTVDFKFWCFTDDATELNQNIEITPLPHGNRLNSWWNKLYLFSRDLPMSRNSTVVYIDLDTLIVDNIDHILTADYQKLTVLRDFYHGLVKSAGRVGSGLMAWRHGAYDYVWKSFMRDPEKAVKKATPHGDQWWIERAVADVSYWQDSYPDQVVSFKVHCRKGLPDQAKIVCYHGRPSIPESAEDTNSVDKWTIAPQPWVLIHWRESTEKCQVRYVELPAKLIFGMVGRCGGGYNSLWEDWSDSGRLNRERIMKEYEYELNKICGHYDKLEHSILVEGIRNPVVITCGYPKRRSINFLPPELLSRPESSLLLLEGTTGGSRLHVAQKHDMTIPCIVNDWTGRFSHYPEILTEQQARSYYADQPELIVIDPVTGYLEGFGDSKVSHHLGKEWSEDRLMPLRAPMWISIMNKHGYQITKLSTRVKEVLDVAGIEYYKKK
jgi:hypothetical protein